MIEPKEAFSFDDVLLVPQYSDIKSRSEVDTSTKIGNLELQVPILSANMDTVTGLEMAVALGRLGAAGVLNRYDSPALMLNSVRLLAYEKLPAIPSIGVKDIDKEMAQEYRKFTSAICLDIAHGDSKLAVDMVNFLKKLDYKTIIAGNVVTQSGAYRLIKEGANVIKVGIGPGAVCSTRSVTGHGYPQLSAIMEVSEVCFNNGAFCIADGGMKNSGDIVKALAAGADAVMTGFLLAGCAECPGKGATGVYRGMASAEAQVAHHGTINNNTAEGISGEVTTKGPVKHVLEVLVGGIRSGLSYSGCHNISELQENAHFKRVAPNTTYENSTRL